MTTARQRAREAAATAVYHRMYSGAPISEILGHDEADAASDVWEEYIREIKSAAESCRYAAPEIMDFHLSRIDRAVKGALGE